MATQGSQDRINRLVDGFNSLTQEYQTLWNKSQALERSLLSARDEVRRAFLCYTLTSCNIFYDEKT